MSDTTKKMSGTTEKLKEASCIMYRSMRQAMTKDSRDHDIASIAEPNVFLVPQQALKRDIGGDAYVFLVGPNKKAVKRTVKATRTYGADWVVSGGLRAGDKIITQGTANLRTGAPIQAVPQGAPQKIVPGKPGAGGAGAGRRGAGGG